MSTVKVLKSGISNFKKMDKSLPLKPKNHMNTKNRDDVKKLIKYFYTSTEEAKTFYPHVLQDFQEFNQENKEAEYPEEPLY